MKTILLANELGDGLNHVNQLIEVARVCARSARVVFGIREDKIKHLSSVEFASRLEYRIIPAMRPLDDAANASTKTFADVLNLFGFSDTERVTTAAMGWREVLNDVKPDLVISDLAPMAYLAAGNSTKIVVVGNGYTVPPAGQMMPPVRPWKSAVPPESRAREGRILAALNTCRERLQGQSINYVSDIFSGDDTFLCSLKSFDPYRGYRAGRWRWPFNIPDILLQPQPTQARSIFVYLPGAHPALEQLIQSLNGLERPARLYISGADADRLASRCRSHIGIFRKPADLGRTLADASLVVHHGGLATCHAALAAGVPQLILPDNLERFLNAQAVVDLKVGRGRNSNPEENKLDLKEEILDLLDNEWQFRAANFAEQLTMCRPNETLEEIVDACMSAMA